MMFYCNVSKMFFILNFFNSFTSNRNWLLRRIYFLCAHIQRRFFSLPWWKTECKCLKPLLRGSFLTAGLHCQQSKCIFQQISNSYTLGSVQASDPSLQSTGTLSQSLLTFNPQSILDSVQLLLTWSGPWPGPLLRSGTVDAYLEELGKMATAFHVSEIQLLTVKNGQTSTQEKCVLEIFPADFLMIFGRSLMLISASPTSCRAEIQIPGCRDAIWLSQIRGNLKINLPCQPIISRKKAHRPALLKWLLSLGCFLQFNQFIHNNPLQVTSLSYLGTDGEFVLDRVLTVALPRARHSLVLCQDFIWLWQGSGYTNLKRS